MGDMAELVKYSQLKLDAEFLTARITLYMYCTTSKVFTARTNLNEVSTKSKVVVGFNIKLTPEGRGRVEAAHADRRPTRTEREAPRRRRRRR